MRPTIAIDVATPAVLLIDAIPEPLQADLAPVLASSSPGTPPGGVVAVQQLGTRQRESALGEGGGDSPARREPVSMSQEQARQRAHLWRRQAQDDLQAASMLHQGSQAALACFPRPAGR